MFRTARYGLHGHPSLVRGAAAVRLIVRAGMLSRSKGERRIAPWEVSDG